MRYPKRRQYKYAKSRYRLRNWADSETGLQRRGARSVWFSKATLEAFRAPATGKPGGQKTYPDLAIEAALPIRRIGRREWHAKSGYNRRSLVENAVFRNKAILGRRMRRRSLQSQRAEVNLACKILNTMRSLGRLDSLKVG
jgi:hypothetical protein